MKRAFLSLYLLLVLSILGMGWGLDQLWNAYKPAQQASLPGQPLLELMQLAAQERELEQTQVFVNNINAAGLAELRLLPLDNLTGSTVLERLHAGENVSFESREGKRYLYQKLSGQPWVLVAEEGEPEGRWLETFLAALFYTALAIAVFFWLWPLTRDLDKLERHAQNLGTDQNYPAVTVPHSSTAHSLAKAFNRMTTRIRELLQTQKEMTHAVSHELRTPLARMKFALEMAGESRNPDDIHSKLEGMRNDVAEMDQLINQLLNYARFEQQRPELNYKAGDMPSLAEEIVRRLTAHLDGNSMHIDIQANLQQDFVCDWPLMERAFLNLVQNALHYSRGCVHIRLFSDAEQFRIEVEDDGPGVPETERDRVFESFVRLRQEPEKHTAGFGLGLAIVRQVALWHKGEAHVENSAPGGALFVIWWPNPLNK
ncbi:ATP-binding protein [Marinimicrobium sp. ABcell2]|uniref:ATP-binding protein n=1 Tax=Marinimicrobium sp. ABcell2 TaxID=3069751 RepID=UPI0027B4CCD0|nr:ATP-binding protein [Marinimicrobium sp. ABcell2]MDQ2075735.1 ATP-binding protein [Marinimicrobium sp. ABcell2]